MLRRMLKSKLHRATVTEADLDYEGSLTIDADLLEAADMLEFEEIHVWNVTNGSRLTTYTMRGEPGSGEVRVNGAGAHLMHPGDLIIIASYVDLEDRAARRHRPRIILLDGTNRVKDSIG